MIPDNVISTRTIRAPFRYPRNIARTDVVDYSAGGVALNDSSQGLEIRTWRGTLDPSTGDISLETIFVPPTVFYRAVNAVSFSFTFDQNMNPFIAYDTETTAHYYWFDTTVNRYVLSTLPAGSQYARCAMDDNRAMETGSSDIILAYLREGVLYFRAQRDRYDVEYTLDSGLDGFKLWQVGLNEKLRFQFQLRPL